MNLENLARWYKDDGEKLRYDYPILTPDSIILDVGAYRGGFSERIYSKYQCKIYALEPIREFFDLIESKFIENDDVQVFNVGLDEFTHKMIIDVADDSSTVFRTHPEHPEEVSLISASEFLRSHSLTSIDLIKINIEGGEYNLLDHLIAEGLIGRFKNIQVQFHDFVESCDDRRDRILEKLFITHTPTYSYPYVWENFALNNKTFVL